MFIHVPTRTQKGSNRYYGEYNEIIVFFFSKNNKKGITWNEMREPLIHFIFLSLLSS